MLFQLASDESQVVGTRRTEDNGSKEQEPVKDSTTQAPPPHHKMKCLYSTSACLEKIVNLLDLEERRESNLMIQFDLSRMKKWQKGQESENGIGYSHSSKYYKLSRHLSILCSLICDVHHQIQFEILQIMIHLCRSIRYRTLLCDSQAIQCFLQLLPNLNTTAVFLQALSLCSLLIRHNAHPSDALSLISIMKHMHKQRKGWHLAALFRALGDISLREDPFNFFHFDGSLNASIIVSPLPVPQQYTLSLWMRADKYTIQKRSRSKSESESLASFGEYCTNIRQKAFSNQEFHNGLEQPPFQPLLSSEPEISFTQPRLFSMLNDTGDGLIFWLRDIPQEQSVSEKYHLAISYYFRGNVSVQVFDQVALKKQKWYHITVTHSPAKLFMRPSEVKLFVNGKWCQTKILAYIEDKKLLTHVFWGTLKHLPQPHCSAQPCLNGQITKLMLLFDALSPERISSLYLDSMASINTLTSTYSSKLVFFYYPHTTAPPQGSRLVFDMSGTTHGLMFGSVRVIRGLSFRDALYCAGGVELLFPLFLDIMPCQENMEQNKTNNPIMNDPIYYAVGDSPDISTSLVPLSPVSLTSLLIFAIGKLIHSSNLLQSTLVYQHSIEVLAWILERTPASQLDLNFLSAINAFQDAVSSLNDYNLIKTSYLRLLWNLRIWRRTDFQVQIEYHKVLLEHVKTKPSYFRELVGIRFLFDNLLLYYNHACDDTPASQSRSLLDVLSDNSDREKHGSNNVQDPDRNGCDSFSPSQVDEELKQIYNREYEIEVVSANNCPIALHTFVDDIFHTIPYTVTPLTSSQLKQIHASLFSIMALETKNVFRISEMKTLITTTLTIRKTEICAELVTFLLVTLKEQAPKNIMFFAALDDLKPIYCLLLHPDETIRILAIRFITVYLYYLDENKRDTMIKAQVTPILCESLGRYTFTLDTYSALLKLLCGIYSVADIQNSGDHCSASSFENITSNRNCQNFSRDGEIEPQPMAEIYHMDALNNKNTLLSGSPNTTLSPLLQENKKRMTLNGSEALQNIPIYHMIFTILRNQTLPTFFKSMGNSSSPRSTDQVTDFVFHTTLNESFEFTPAQMDTWKLVIYLFDDLANLLKLPPRISSKDRVAYHATLGQHISRLLLNMLRNTSNLIHFISQFNWLDHILYLFFHTEAYYLYYKSNRSDGINRQNPAFNLLRTARQLILTTIDTIVQDVLLVKKDGWKMIQYVQVCVYNFYNKNFDNNKIPIPARSSLSANITSPANHYNDRQSCDSTSKTKNSNHKTSNIVIFKAQHFLRRFYMRMLVSLNNRARYILFSKTINLQSISHFWDNISRLFILMEEFMFYQPDNFYSLTKNVFSILDPEQAIRKDSNLLRCNMHRSKTNFFQLKIDHIDTPDHCVKQPLSINQNHDANHDKEALHVPGQLSENYSTEHSNYTKLSPSYQSNSSLTTEYTMVGLWLDFELACLCIELFDLFFPPSTLNLEIDKSTVEFTSPRHSLPSSDRAAYALNIILNADTSRDLGKDKPRIYVVLSRLILTTLFDAHLIFNAPSSLLSKGWLYLSRESRSPRPLDSNFFVDMLLRLDKLLKFLTTQEVSFKSLPAFLYTSMLSLSFANSLSTVNCNLTTADMILFCCAKLCKFLIHSAKNESTLHSNSPSSHEIVCYTLKPLLREWLVYFSKPQHTISASIYEMFSDSLFISKMLDAIETPFSEWVILAEQLIYSSKWPTWTKKLRRTVQMIEFNAIMSLRSMNERQLQTQRNLLTWMQNYTILPITMVNSGENMNYSTPILISCLEKHDIANKAHIDSIYALQKYEAVRTRRLVAKLWQQLHISTFIWNKELLVEPLTPAGTPFLKLDKTEIRFGMCPKLKQNWHGTRHQQASRWLHHSNPRMKIPVASMEDGTVSTSNNGFDQFSIKSITHYAHTPQSVEDKLNAKSQIVQEEDQDTLNIDQHTTQKLQLDLSTDCSPTCNTTFDTTQSVDDSNNISKTLSASSENNELLQPSYPKHDAPNSCDNILLNTISNEMPTQTSTPSHSQDLDVTAIPVISFDLELEEMLTAHDNQHMVDLNVSSGPSSTLNNIPSFQSSQSTSTTTNLNFSQGITDPMSPTNHISINKSTISSELPSFLSVPNSPNSTWSDHSEPIVLFGSKVDLIKPEAVIQGQIFVSKTHISFLFDRPAFDYYACQLQKQQPSLASAFDSKMTPLSAKPLEENHNAHTSSNMTNQITASIPTTEHQHYPLEYRAAVTLFFPKMFCDRVWPLNEVIHIYLRRYRLHWTALEIVMSSRRQILFNFHQFSKVQRIYSILISLNLPKLGEHQFCHASDYFKQCKHDLTDRWCHREISNFTYLMELNRIASRSVNDLTHYPVFPWILSNYTSSTLDLNDARNYRDLQCPIGALGPNRLAKILERYAAFDDDHIPPFHYGSHYSTAGAVLFYMIRVEPFTSQFLCLQGGKFDYADRMFASIQDAWENCLTSTTDVKELIPEFFYFPEFLKNRNALNLGKRTTASEPIDDVILPPWAKGSAHEFIRLHRQALESEYVSQNLHHWIDLIFGYKQTGPAAVATHNTFFHLTYESSVKHWQHETDFAQLESILSQIENFGQTPPQLLDSPHPPRDVAKCNLTPQLLLSSLSENNVNIIPTSHGEDVPFPMKTTIQPLDHPGLDAHIKLFIPQQELQMPFKMPYVLIELSDVQILSINAWGEYLLHLWDSKKNQFFVDTRYRDIMIEWRQMPLQEFKILFKDDPEFGDSLDHSASIMSHDIDDDNLVSSPTNSFQIGAADDQQDLQMQGYEKDQEKVSFVTQANASDDDLNEIIQFDEQASNPTTDASLKTAIENSGPTNDDHGMSGIEAKRGKSCSLSSPHSSSLYDHSTPTISSSTSAVDDIVCNYAQMTQAHAFLKYIATANRRLPHSLADILCARHNMIMTYPWDPRWMVTFGDWDGSLQLLFMDPSVDTVIRYQLCSAHSMPITCVGFDRKWMVSGSEDTTAVLWRIQYTADGDDQDDQRRDANSMFNTNDIIGSPTLCHSVANVPNVVSSFSSNKALSSLKTLTNMTTFNPKPRLQIVVPSAYRIDSHDHPLTCVVVSDDWQVIVTASQDGLVAIHHLNQKRPVTQLLLRHATPITQIVIGSDGTIVSCEANCGQPILQRYSINGELLAECTLNLPQSPSIVSHLFILDRRSVQQDPILLFALCGTFVLVFQWEKLFLIGKLPLEKPISHACLSKDLNTLFVAQENGKLTVFDTYQFNDLLQKDDDGHLKQG